MKKVLINFAHPNIGHSKINKALIKEIDNIDNVTINNLYSNYPDFIIDVKREQKLCEENDIIIFQFPFYWYSTPSIMKEWQDVVLEHDWAYGSKGKALKGKTFMLSLTAGGDESTYTKDGGNLFTIGELATPFQAMTNLCSMEWMPPFAILGIHRGLSDEKLNAHKNNYRKLILALRDEILDIDKIKKEKYCNCELSEYIRRQ